MNEIPISLCVDELDIIGRLYIPERAGEVSSPGLIICHGIPAQVKTVDDQGYPLLARRFCNADFTTFIFNFRGAGLSSGNFDIRGWSRDLRAAIDFVQPKVDCLFLMGFSAGAAVSIHVAAQDRRVAGVVSCASPAHFRVEGLKGLELLEHSRRVNIIKEASFPPSVDDWLAGFSEVKPIKWVDKISPRPLLLIHGDLDDVVPVSHAHSLYRQAKEPKEIKIISGFGHRLRLDETAMKFALDWLKARVTVDLGRS